MYFVFMWFVLEKVYIVFIDVVFKCLFLGKDFLLFWWFCLIMLIIFFVCGERLDGFSFCIGFLWWRFWLINYFSFCLLLFIDFCILYCMNVGKCEKILFRFIYFLDVFVCYLGDKGYVDDMKIVFFILRLGFGLLLLFYGCLGSYFFVCFLEIVSVLLKYLVSFLWDELFGFFLVLLLLFFWFVFFFVGNLSCFLLDVMVVM